jgi:outer membrane protein assembly factor BamB
MKRLLSVLVVAALIAGCGDSKNTDPPADLVDLKPTLTIDKLWSYSFGGDADHLRLALRVAVVDNVAYGAGFNGEVAAISVESGKKIWSVKTKLPLTGGPGVGEGIVVIGAKNGELIALDSKDGKERWRHRMSSEVLAMPVLAHGIVVVRTVDGRLVGLAAANAEQKWVVEQPVPKLSLRGTAPAFIAGDTVIAGFDNGRVVAVDLTTGDTQWDTAVGAPKGKNELERLVDIDAPVRAIGDDVFVTGFQGRVAMLARDSGQIWWARDFSSYRGFTVEGDSLVASSAEGLVIAMRRNDGQINWEQAGLRQRGLTAPAVDGDAVVVGDYEGYLHWLNITNGELIARTSTDGERITNAPLSVDGRIFVQTDGGKLIAYKSKSKTKS